MTCFCIVHYESAGSTNAVAWLISPHKEAAVSFCVRRRGFVGDSGVPLVASKPSPLGAGCCPSHYSVADAVTVIALLLLLLLSVRFLQCLYAGWQQAQGDCG